MTGAEANDGGYMFFELRRIHVVDVVDVAIDSVPHRVVGEYTQSLLRPAREEPRSGRDRGGPEPLRSKREGHGAKTCAVTMSEVYGESTSTYGKVGEWKFVLR